MIARDMRFENAGLHRDREPAWEGGLVPLMEIMLSTIERCQAAVLQDESENLLVLRGMLRQLIGGTSRAAGLVRLDPPSRTTRVTQRLAALLSRVLRQPEDSFPRAALQRDHPHSGASPGGEPIECPSLAELDPLARWFQALAQRLRATHPCAVPMLRLRFLGLGSEAIAERLQLPPRLVQQVLVDVRSGVGTAGEESDTQV